MNQVFAICGYGLFDQKNSKYKKYLDFVVEYIKKNKFKSVIPLGGFTSSNNQNVSEAQSIEKYLRSNLKNININYIREDKSINSKQNIHFLKKLLPKVPSKLNIICDETRKLKIFWLALYYFYRLSPEKIIHIIKSNQGDKFENADFNKDFIYKNICVIGYNFNRTKNQTLWQQLGTVEEILGIYNSRIDKQSQYHRKKLFKLK